MQTSQSLQQDYGAVTASLLTELVGVQKAISFGGNGSSVPASSLNFNSAFVPSNRDVWLNGLWFVSLIFTLLAALIAGILKQWINHYLVDTAGTPRDRACTRQFRYMGLRRWGVSSIIELLSVLMSLSLLLFLIGLILYTQDLNGMSGIHWFLVVVTCLASLSYAVTSMLPIWLPDCPYKTSLTQVFSNTIKLFWILYVHYSEYDFSSLFGSLIFSDLSRVHWLRDDVWFSEKAAPRVARWLRLGSSLRVAEATKVAQQKEHLQVKTIAEVVTKSTNPSAISVSLQSLASIHSLESLDHNILLPLWSKLQTGFSKCFRLHVSDRDEDLFVLPKPTIERLSRALLSLAPIGLHMELTLQKRMLAFCLHADHDPVRSAALAVILARHSSSREENTDQMRGIFFKLIQSPPVRSRSVHPWIYNQLKDFPRILQEWFPYGSEEKFFWKPLREQLLLLHTFEGDLTLQEELLIRCLHERIVSEGSVVPGLTSKETVCRFSITTISIFRYTQRETITAYRLLEILPHLGRGNFSWTDDTRYINLLGNIFSGHLFVGKENAMSHMEVEIWSKTRIRLPPSELYAARIVEKLGILLDRLCSNVGYVQDERKPSHISAIAGTQKAMYSCGRSSYHGGSIFNVLFDWLLTYAASLNSEFWTNITESEREAQERIMGDVFYCLFGVGKYESGTNASHLWDGEDARGMAILQGCQTFLETKNIPGFPIIVRDGLEAVLSAALRNDKQSMVMEYLSDLLLYFLQQDSEQSDYRGLDVSQQRATLGWLLDFGIKWLNDAGIDAAPMASFDAVLWKEMVADWHEILEAIISIGEDLFLRRRPIMKELG